ncbi:hypothetical protein KCU78_g69, partial [Aureobasidium melanogenum]
MKTGISTSGRIQSLVHSRTDSAIQLSHMGRLLCHRRNPSHRSRSVDVGKVKRHGTSHRIAEWQAASVNTPLPDIECPRRCVGFSSWSSSSCRMSFQLSSEARDCLAKFLSVQRYAPSVAKLRRSVPPKSFDHERKLEAKLLTLIAMIHKNQQACDAWNCVHGWTLDLILMNVLEQIKSCLSWIVVLEKSEQLLRLERHPLLGSLTLGSDIGVASRRRQLDAEGAHDGALSMLRCPFFEIDTLDPCYTTVVRASYQAEGEPHSQVRNPTWLWFRGYLLRSLSECRLRAMCSQVSTSGLSCGSIDSVPDDPGTDEMPPGKAIFSSTTTGPGRVG